MEAIVVAAEKGFSEKYSLIMGVEVGGRLLVSASASTPVVFFWDSDALYTMNS